jgi:hypothetical protein
MPEIDTVKIACLEVRQEEHMRNFSRHCAEEEVNFNALFAQIRSLEGTLASMEQKLSSQKGFIAGVVFCTTGLFAIVVAGLNYFIKA